jgi:hypothetical protein
MEPASGALIGAAAVAAGAYLNAKMGIGTDLKVMREEREFGERLGRRIRELGDTCTLFRMFDIVSPEKEALWFEGKTWTYGELKIGTYRLYNSKEDLKIDENCRNSSTRCVPGV